MMLNNFTALLDRLQQSDEIKSQGLGDAKIQVNYADLPHYFEKINLYFQNHGIKNNECIAFECTNTTAALITLLALFYRGQHILLLPAEGNALKEPHFKPMIPEFCKTHISVHTMDSLTTLTPDTLIKGINLYPHQAFNETIRRRLNFLEPQLLLRTSGSMGDAKIVLFSHDKLIGNASNCVSRFNVNTQSRVTITVPIFHLYGLGAALIPALMVGASIDLQADTNVLRFMEHQRRFKPDVVYLNPTLCAMLVKIRRKNQQPFKQTISAGAPLSTPLHQQYQQHFGLLANLYGSTEMGAAATTTSATEHLKPMPNVQINIDTNNQRLYCSHPYGFGGYITSEGHMLQIKTYPYDTGDIAKTQKNGCFEVISRAGESCNRAGFLVQFNDVEKALLNIEAINEAVVLTHKKRTILGEKLYAFCVLNHAELSAQRIRQLCFSSLPKYAIPDEIILLDSLPLLANGKTDRQTLKLSLT